MAEPGPTSACTLLSSVHGRDRRALRRIEKRDLQAAVRHGRKERTHSQRWKYTFANVVYITDDSSTREVTSYVLPMVMDLAPESVQDISLHEQAARVLQQNPGKCTSHTVLVVDQSGSMRTCDVEDFKTRSDAVFGTMALDLLGRQIDHGGCSLTDAVTLIEMRDEAATVFEREPMTNVLYNKMLRRMQETKPSYHGNYIPALEAAANALSGDAGNPSCALLLVFLSDGKPSDAATCWWHNPADIEEWVRYLARRFGSQLTVGMIGFAGGSSDFGVLRSMAEAATEAGAHGTFSYSGQSSAVLSAAISSLGSRLSATRTRITALTALGGSREGRTQRPCRSAGRAGDPDAIDAAGWLLYAGSTRRVKSEWGGKNRGWMDEALACSVAVRKQELGRGAERVVYELRHFAQAGAKCAPLGEKLVAKESVFVEDDALKKEFHYIFCKTQQQAGRFARKFNEAVARACGRHRVPIPAVLGFLPCAVYVLYGASEDEFLAVLVEKMLDRRLWTKWNSNAGYVHGSGPGLGLGQDKQPGAGGAGSDVDDDAAVAGVGKLPAIAEETDSEGEHDDDRGDKEPGGELQLQDCDSRRLCSASAADVPQAFSHWTYRYSQRKSLVCDLQGTLDASVSPPVFELTDPVIHHASMQRSRVYGRTDHGRRGIQRFFQSHTCNSLCRLLGLPPDP